MPHIHKAFILGAGFGTRLQPLTHHLPKPLVPLFHEPLASYTMRHCLDAGIQSFAINTHHLPHAWNDTYPDSRFQRAPISFFHEPTLLETGGGLKNISSFISRDPILVYNGDILTNLNLEALFKTHTSSNNLATLALFSSGPNPNVAVQDNQIIDLRHSRGIHPGTHQFTGIYVVEPEILRLIPSNKKISVVPAFLQLAEQNQLGSYIADGASWHDLGTPDEYFAAHQYLRQISNNPKSIHPTAVIHPSADIDLDTCVVGRNCVIEKNVKLRHTIAWPETTIKQGTSLENIIITPQCQTAF